MWEKGEKYLEKTFEFNSFIEAISFINQIVPIAESMKHHPDILIHSYSKVKIMLFTHDKNKISDLDYSMAQKIDQIL